MYYLFNTPRGRLAIFANSDNEAAKLLFQKAGLTVGDPSIRGEGLSQTAPSGYSIITPTTNAQSLERTVTGTSPQLQQSFSTGDASNEGVALGPMTAQPTPITGGGAPTLPSGEFARQDPNDLGREGGFLRALIARGIDPGTFVGAGLRSRQEEFENLFNVMQLTGMVPEGERSFEQFASQTGSPRTGALQFIRDVATRQAAGQLTDPLREFINPTDPAGAGIRRTSNALVQALQGRVGSIADNPWLRTLTDRLAGEFAAQPQQQQSQTPFFDFARQRIGLF